jgi:magnesium chelatase family protein
MGSVCKVLSVAPVGFDGKIIEVESDMTKGLPALAIVGLGNKAIDEAKERVKSAITNTLLEYPAKRITINLAPAELPKDGTHYDLPIALALLVSSGQLRQEEVSNAIFAGELALDGRIRPISGAITIAEAAKKAGFTTVYLPQPNTVQARLVDGITIYGVDSLKSLFLHLKKEALLTPIEHTASPTLDTSATDARLDDIYGQEQAKRALIIAAAGHHNILFGGTPGAGKTMLAKTLNDLLPPLTPEEQLEVTKLHSLSGSLINEVVLRRPFRAPHHTSSQIALVGGGTKARPGEISLAHHGVLFLDEIPEYPRSVLEALRQPLEDRIITVARANSQAVYPADFMLVATMNPCPCGYYGDPERECSCTSTQILTYQKRLSGPLLDRIDMTLSVSRIPHDQLLTSKSMSNSQHQTAVKTIISVRNIQHKRYNSSVKNNSSLTNADIKRFANLAPAAKLFLDDAAKKLKLSARSYFKVIKVGRTIADIEASKAIEIPHIAEALQYRQTT